MGNFANQYWFNFIKSGNPNGEGLPDWTPDQTNKDNIFMFDNKGVEASGMIKDPWKKRLDLVEKLVTK